MSLTLAGLVLIAALLYASWSMIGETARGERWITLSRSSRQSPEAVWRRVEDAWSRTALTFEPVQILPDSSEQLKNFSLKVEAHEYRTTLKRLPPSEPRSLTITCVSASGQPYPLGRNHRKIWRVEPNGTGSVIRLAVTFKAPPRAIIQALFTFNRQLRLIAGS